MTTRTLTLSTSTFGQTNTKVEHWLDRYNELAGNG